MEVNRANWMKTYHLELNSLGELIEARPQATLSLQVVSAQGDFNRRLYEEVGAAWQWRDRLPWSATQWQHWAARPEIITLVAKLDTGEEIGYAELERQTDHAIEIVYFGLKAPYVGHGLGGALLTLVVKEAWSRPDTKRVWVHTCTADHEYALANYQARGFKIFRIEEGP